MYKNTKHKKQAFCGEYFLHSALGAEVLGQTCIRGKSDTGKQRVQDSIVSVARAFWSLALPNLFLAPTLELIGLDGSYVLTQRFSNNPLRKKQLQYHTPELFVFSRQCPRMLCNFWVTPTRSHKPHSQWSFPLLCWYPFLWANPALTSSSWQSCSRKGREER